MQRNKGIQNIREPLAKMKLHDEYDIGFNSAQGISDSYGERQNNRGYSNQGRMEEEGINENTRRTRNSMSVDAESANGNRSVASNVLSNFSKLEEGFASLGIGINEVVQDLESKGIKVEQIFEKWPDYFSEPVPRFKSHEIKQILVINFCHKFLCDFEKNRLTYLTWRRKGGVYDDEVYLDYKVVGIPQNTNFIVNSRNSYDEKLAALFRHFVEIPEATISACNLALDILNTTKLHQEPKKIVTRIINTPGLDHVKNASSSNIGKFLKIRCKVISVSAPKVYIKNIVRKIVSPLPC